MKRRTSFLLVAFVLGAATLGAQPAPRPYAVTTVMLQGVTLREGVTADLALSVFSSPEQPCPGRTVLAVHGMLHTAAAWEPLVTTLLGELPPAGQRPCRAVALDLPGHGRSSLPFGALFGELTVDDYVTAVLGTLDRLHYLGVFPDTLVGHSLGGAIVILAQQRLHSAQSSLRGAHDVRNVVLLGAAVLNPVSNPEWDSGAMLGPLLAYAQESPEMGRYVAVPVTFWRNPMFKNLATPPQFASGTPSVEEIIARGYFGPIGSATAPESRGMFESMMPRPSVDPALFDVESGTKLTMVVYEQDRAVRLDPSLEFYTYLTTDFAAGRVIVVPGPDAVHDTHISNPALLVEALGSLRPQF